MCFEPRSLYYSTEPEVYISYFDGNKNVEEWETKLDKIFKKYKVDEYTGFFFTLCFQEYARSWWQQRKLDVKIGTTSKV